MQVELLMTRLRARWWAFGFGQGKDFYLLHPVQTSWRIHTASYPVGIWSYSSGSKAAGAWNWLTSISVKVKNVWIFTSNPPYVFMERCLIKHRDIFKFTIHTQNLHMNTDTFLLVVL
jgi:hypothetical protein